MIALLLLAALLTDSATTVLDLRSSWRCYRNGAYQVPGPEQLDDEHTIYFPVDTRKHGGQFLYVSSVMPAHIFVDGKLIASVRNETVYEIDSLTVRSVPVAWVAIHTAGKLSDLSTRIVSLSQQEAIGVPPMHARPPTYFQDFGILVSVFLVAFFLLLLRGNPQLTLDYFSFSKIFSSSERNETQFASRIASSENLLFYLFCALFAGFLLSAIFYSSGPFFQAARPLVFDSFGSSFLIWGRLSVFILMLLAAKLAIVLIFSTLFNFRETVSFQFFNFLRFVLFTAIVLAGVSLLLFLFRVSSPSWYEQLVATGLAMLTLGSAMVLMKLLRKSQHSFFHLFSYLCISEFIPLVILFKIFF